ncbi:1-aminocyclopropane-1-carboxylate oxidase homolog 4-like, partial [Camellia sinensis]|uniref:1-aminocyclopropane-1-carboxylate oxidase homolog 4-like n=1 Tax=Camellia sinensis TaxID=4442 RepID=UPI0010360A03
MAVIASTDYDRMKEVKEFDDSKIGVKGLSDSGVTAIPKFFIQPPETLSTLKSSSFNTGGIPVIDLSNINSPKLRPNIVSQIREAAKTWGFFQVINHGVPNYIINKTLMSIRSFHEQPQEIKAEHYVRDEFNGFVYASNNDLLRSKVASWHDYVNAWMWPDAVEAEKIPAVCREEVVEWDRYVTDVGEKVAELLSEGLGLAAGKLKEEGLLGSRLIAGVYYPYCPQPNLTFGLNPHTDPGVLTVLVENQVMGLQVKHEGEWVDVKPLPGSLIVNIGDALQVTLVHIPTYYIYIMCMYINYKKMSTQRNRGQVGNRSASKGTTVPLATVVAASIVAEEVVCEIVNAVQDDLACNEGDNGHTLKLIKEFLCSNPPQFVGEAKLLEAEDWLEQITKTLDRLRVEDEELRISL